MEESERLKAYLAMGEISRKWAASMDSKASFLAALNAATLAFIWSYSKLAEASTLSGCLAFGATIFVLLSLVLALRVILPRINLKHTFGKSISYESNYKPVSFFGYVAQNYTPHQFAAFRSEMERMDTPALIEEAIEQHFTISHLVQKKAVGVSWSGWLWLLAAILTVVATLARNAYGG